MAQPYDYTLHVDSPFKAAVEGYKGGALFRDDQLQQQQLQLAQQQKLQQQEDFAKVANNPNASPSDFAALTLKYPSFKDQFKQANDMLSEDQKQNTLKSGTEVYAALAQNSPDIAKQLLMKRAAALRNSGDEQGAKHAEAISGVIDINPVLARNMLGLSLTAADDKFASNVSTLNTDARATAEAPADLAIKNATAGIKSTEAAAAPAKAQADLANTQSQIEDRKAGQRIAELNTQIGQANSETQRGQLILQRDELQLKRDDAQAKRDITKGETGTATQDALDSANALKEQIKGVANHPGLEAGTGTLSGIRSYFNSTDANDFRKAVEGLKSPVFLNELGKLKTAGVTLGQVTETEGKKLEQRIANLDPDQSTPSFKNQVGILMKDTEKFINKIVASGKLPTTGGAFVETIPGVGQVNEGDINWVLRQRPGWTREQVLQRLRNPQSGGATGGY